MRFILLLLLPLSCVAKTMPANNPCVLVAPDGKVSVKYFVKPQSEAHIKRANGGQFCHKVKPQDIPKDRKHRDKWRWNPEKRQIFIDTNIKSKNDIIAEHWEIAKSSKSTVEQKVNALVELYGRMAK